MITITDEQRREVAAELRRQAAYGDGNLGEWWQRLQDIALGEVDFPKPEQLFERLADLIDRPTCHNVLDEVDVFECSECQWSFYTENPNGGWEEPCCCIHCGAEVVR